MTDYNYLFVSDLHISEGRDPSTGKLSPLEDFLHDRAFARFLVYHVELNRAETSDPRKSDKSRMFDKPWKLVLNGDIFDFLQVTTLPAVEQELARVAGCSNYNGLSSNEQEYGLGTESSATVWKLERIARGHPLFFQALGWFLAAVPGNEILLVKGNHDVELFWPDVQLRLRELVEDAYREWKTGLRLDSPLPPHLHSETPEETIDFGSRLQFPPWFVHEAGLFYADHGNQYDPSNSFSDFLQPILRNEDGTMPPEDKQVVELPRGSFLVRYFFNEVE